MLFTLTIWFQKRDVHNAVHKYIRCISSCSVVSFNCKLDCLFEEHRQSPWQTWIQQQPGLWKHFTMVDNA